MDAAVRIVSARLNAALRTTRRADLGKTKRKLVIAGHRLVPKRGGELLLSSQEYEECKDEIDDYVASGIVEVHFLDPSAAPPPPKPEPKDDIAEADAGGSADEDDEEDSWTREELEAKTKAELVELLEDMDAELTGKEKKDELIELVLLGE